MLCTKDGLLESEFTNNEPKYTRGDVAQTKPLLRVKERFQLTEKKERPKEKP